MADTALLQYLEGFLTEERKQKFAEILSGRTNHFTVAIEDVYQMHNTSAVIRSCDVFGIQKAHIIEERFGHQLDKNIAMGAQKWVDVHRYASTQNCIKELREKGYRIIATTPHNDSCFVDDFDVSEKSALFFGTEKEGLSEEVMAEADGYLKIPMAGFTESLNISVSAAIILHTLTEKLRRSDISWQLTEEEVLEKRIDWAKKSIRSSEDVLKRYYSGYSEFKTRGNDKDR
ncbi:TrmH family RNA methyltransferase [Sinomicrobium weinanense]|uniref:tRNA (guanosine(18)-2'-O)-methyltransferase n=1 Tax=Sinomicrobium weinanense TaxID=2842200 RepID=A0A926Q4P6_9FLAO|nr:RNA methyltransferase [Sinomicrobium weinanense]MBC9797306.1 RNA methyltransferase [Sinomicrobium weinanense]MBU3122775.1 RNA methyltransferase [Sinomicrobium weinanense]